MLNKILQFADKLSQQGFSKEADLLRKASMSPFLKDNYDYGEGLYMNMDKYDSVQEFLDAREKQKKKRKKYKHP